MMSEITGPARTSDEHIEHDSNSCRLGLGLGLGLGLEIGIGLS